MNLGGLARRIDRLKQQSRPVEDRPMVVCYLPDNGRGPGGVIHDVRVVELAPNVRVIHCPAELPRSPLRG
jgi:hypothetical protein